LLGFLPSASKWWWCWRGWRRVLYRLVQHDRRINAVDASYVRVLRAVRRDNESTKFSGVSSWQCRSVYKYTARRGASRLAPSGRDRKLRSHCKASAAADTATMSHFPTQSLLHRRRKSRETSVVGGPKVILLLNWNPLHLNPCTHLHLTYAWGGMVTSQFWFLFHCSKIPYDISSV